MLCLGQKDNEISKENYTDIYLTSKRNILTEASDDESTTESEFENNYDDDDAESDAESYKLRSESVNSVLTKNTTIALYSSSNSLELFYLCKVIDFGVAIENMIDEYNHIIPQGSRYIESE